MWDSESESTNYNGVLTLNHAVQTDRFEQRGRSWYVATHIPSDFLVQIGGFSFHLHKSPLLSKSGKMNRIIQESKEIDSKKVILDDLPGGAESFELAAKFCYGIAIDLTSTVIAGLRCAAEYLEMTEEFEEGNLIFKTEAFLNYVVMSSWKDSILVLKSCEKLSPWAENLQIVRRCSESVALKACAGHNRVRWKQTGKQDSSPSRSRVLPDWWCEDISILNIDHFVRVITAIKVKGMRYELIGSAIMHYATKSLPGMIKEGSTGSVEEGASSSNSATATGGDWNCRLHMIIAVNKGDHSSSPQGRCQRMIIESLISIIPSQNDSVSCSFLLRLLRLATMVDVAPALITELEKRVGMQLEQATLADLLIPSYNRSETMYDVDLFQRVLEHFLIQEKMEISSPRRQPMIDKNKGTRGGNDSSAKMKVARLVDGYLTEVSKDKNLSLPKFQVLVEALPESARSCDDGIYRAIDSYLKAHPMLQEHDRRRLCKVMDIQKLSLDACRHAAQNERLPLRVVVQVIFSEQIKLSNTIANTVYKASGEPNYQPIIPNRKTLLEETPQSFQDGWATAKKDITTLKFDVETVKTKYLELQHDIESLQRQYDKITKLKHRSAWSSGWKKLSKITKITTIEDTGIGSQGNTEHTVKTPRRWRNSLS
ncbi:root phototropism protein 3-like [Cynara cardunculus var. scolymus]|uniref:root phototropism protein 3-like n=1 Tax=Cynara cardunculus var. scolymus TaxID=59895 RepID=UPI000D629E39|nr:root phototropism protein 3-like [Cynara cardunculus var. scolymus]